MLKYKHPHTEVRIYDNSELEEEIVGGSSTLFCPFFSERGIDNTLINIRRDCENGRYDFGTRNWKEHGQHIYNMYQWLDGRGDVFGIRLMPSDATYSNLVLNIKTRPVQVPVYEKNSDGEFIVDLNNERIPVIDDSDPLNPKAVTTNGVEIKHEMIYLDRITRLDTIEERLDSLSEHEKYDSEGYKNHYLAAFFVGGRGKYGNKVSVSMSLNKLYEKTYDFRIYNISILEKTSEGDVKLVDGPFEFSFFPESIAITRNSMYLENVISDYTNKIRCICSESQYDDLIDDIMAATQDSGGTDLSPNEIDFISAVDKNGNMYENIIINEDSSTLDYYEGIRLQGGSDGSIDPKGSHLRLDDNGDPIKDGNGNYIYDANTTTYVRNTMDSLLLDAYRGIITPEVFNTFMYEFDVIMDANNSNPVKYQMCQFAEEREDVFCYIDSGFQASVESTLRWRKKDFQINRYSVSLQGQSMTYEDPDTLEIIPVTPTFYLSYLIPHNDYNHGIGVATAGPSYGVIENYKSISWFPNEIQKEDLWDAKINYYEEDRYRTMRMTHLTSQFKESALSRESNVRILKIIARNARKAVRQFYNLRNSSTVLSAIQNAIYQANKEFVDRSWLDRYTVSVSQTAYERQRNICHITITLGFTGFLERFLIDINVEKAQ